MKTISNIEMLGFKDDTVVVKKIILALKTTMFLFQLERYEKDWRSVVPKLSPNIMTRIEVSCSQVTSSYYDKIRGHLLQGHLLSLNIFC